MSRELFLILLLSIGAVKGYTYFKSCEYSSTFQSLENSSRCFLNGDDPMNRTLNVDIQFKKPLKAIKMDFEFFMKITPTTPYRSLLKNDNINYCENVKGGNMNTALQWIINNLGTTIQKHVHPCPYSGKLAILDLVITNYEQVSKMRLGSLKVTVKFHNKSDENLLTVNVYLENVDSKTYFKTHAKPEGYGKTPPKNISVSSKKL